MPSYGYYGRIVQDEYTYVYFSWFYDNLCIKMLRKKKWFDLLAEQV